MIGATRSSMQMIWASEPNVAECLRSLAHALDALGVTDNVISIDLDLDEHDHPAVGAIIERPRDAEMVRL